MFEAQKALSDYIGYECEDKFEKDILALYSELGELSKEWRGFKYWSKNQKPIKVLHTTAGANAENAVYAWCGECAEKTYTHDYEFEKIVKRDHECSCGYEVDYFRAKNPLLEEYVDCLHFILEIGIGLKVNPSHIEMAVDTSNIKTHSYTDITSQFICIADSISRVCKLKSIEEYEIVLLELIALGEMLGLAWEEIEQAYYEKNKINHERQDNGY